MPEGAPPLFTLSDLPTSYKIIRQPGRFVRFKRLRQPFSITEDEGMILPTVIPRDYGNWIFLLLVLHSIVIALPWNIFMIFKQEVYVSYGFHFIPLIGIGALLPNLIIKVIFLFIIVWKDLSVMAWKLVIFLNIFFAFSTAVWSIRSPKHFTNRTAIFVVFFIIMNIITALLEVYCHFLVDIFPSHYTGAHILGKHICAVVVSILVSIAFAASSSYWCVLIMFYFSALTCFVCVVAMCCLSRRPFFVFRARTAMLEEPQYLPPLQMAEIIDVYKENSSYFFKVFWVSFIPSALFPSIIETVQPDMKIVGDLTCFLLYNFCAALGALTMQPIKMTNNAINLTVIAQTLFLPFFLLSRLQIKHRDIFTPFANAWVFSTGLTIFGFISGFLEHRFVKPNTSDAEHMSKEVKPGITRITSVFGSICGLALSILILQKLPFIGSS